MDKFHPSIWFCIGIWFATAAEFIGGDLFGAAIGSTVAVGFLWLTRWRKT